jgi:hypothetical protein
MSGTWRVLVAFSGVVGMFAFWFVVFIVVPGLLAVYVARLFPLTGEWRKRFRARSKRD